MPVTSNNLAGSKSGDYVLGYSSSENDRLIRQAALLAPLTERMFREAGIGSGQHVLDLGSGMGDVALLAARLVGPSGEVVGIERDAGSIERARARVAEAGLSNIRFTQTDVNQIRSDQPFDAAVGRFILMFLPDPVSVLAGVSRLVRAGGVVAFQETSWKPSLAFAAQLPLWSRLLRAIHQTLLASGANPEMGPDLYALFQKVGLPVPAMHMETLLGSDAELIQLKCGIIRSLRPLAETCAVDLKGLGDLDTLADRIQAEAAAHKAVLNFVPIVSAWARKPEMG